MSTGAECEFIEAEVGRWYYVIETGNTGRYDDWRDFAEAFGPFSSLSQAEQHCSENHANPGGSGVCPHPAAPCAHANTERYGWAGEQREACEDCFRTRPVGGDWPPIDPAATQEVGAKLAALIARAHAPRPARRFPVRAPFLGRYA